MLVWVDVETTGLDPDDDSLLEVAVVITDDALSPVRNWSSWITDQARYRSVYSLNPYVREMHAKNGLWEESIRRGTALSIVREDVMDFVRRHAPEPKTAILAGSSVWFDRGFLKKCIPELVDHLNYRILDVSSINEVARRFWPDVYAARPQKKEEDKPHRALDDIFESIKVLEHYTRFLGITSMKIETAEVIERKATTVEEFTEADDPFDVGV